MSDRIEELEAEVAEQCRLNAMGQERELKLLTEIKRLREALRTVRYGCETAEEQAAARYGTDWRNEVIDKALERE